MKKSRNLNKNQIMNNPMKEITAEELKARMDAKADFTLIDVREPLEYETGNIQGISIPVGQVLDRIDEIPKNGDVIIHCKAGSRSANVIHYLQSELGYDNLINLKGGILAWKMNINPNLDVL